MQEKIGIENQFRYYEQKSNDFVKKALDDLKTEYESKDWEIFHSNWRKNQGYIPHGTRSRTITTIFGDLTYSRHRYKHWDKYKYRYVYLSDLELGIEKYQRITNHLQVKILSLIAEGKRYQDILDCFPNVKFHCRTISNIISRTKINSWKDTIEIKQPKIKVDQCLYINVDDTFLTLKVAGKKRKFRVRVILFYTGYDLIKSSNKKKVLKNVRFFGYLVRQKSKIDTQEFMDKVYNLANSFYENLDNVKIIIAGDGAPWIRQCSSYWPGSIYILDKFHAVRNIGQVFSSKNDMTKVINQEAKALFTTGNYSDLMLLLKQKWFNDPAKILKLTKLRSYFINNEKEANGITNQNHQDNIGCNIEGAISHHVKWLLGYGSKAFSKDVYSKMLDIHIAKVNGISIIDLLRENINTKLKQKQSFFRQNFWQKHNKFDNRYELAITKNGNVGRWAKNFSSNF